MPTLNPYRRPSLKQLAFGFLMLLAKDVACAETPMQTITPATTTGHPTQPSFTHCQHPLNEITPILTPSGLWSFAHFKDETAIGNSLSFLTDHPEIQDICNQHGENYLFHLANHGSNDDFSNAIALSKPQHTHIKNLADESLMDILIEQNNLHKINTLVQTLHEASLFKRAFKHLTHSLLESRKKDITANGLTLLFPFAVHKPTHPMNTAAKNHLIKMIDADFVKNPHEYARSDIFIISAACSLPIMVALTFVYLSLFLRNDNNPGNNPNALFNQLNLPEERRTEPETKPRLS